METELFCLTSLTGVVHRVHKTGIFTDNIYHPFSDPILFDISKAATSSSGLFIYLIIEGRLFLVSVTNSRLYSERIGNTDAVFLDASFNNEETRLITLTNDCAFHYFELYPVKHICMTYIKLNNYMPISFQYFQLQEMLMVLMENGEHQFFKFPDFFNLPEFLEPIIDDEVHRRQNDEQQQIFDENNQDDDQQHQNIIENMGNGIVQGGFTQKCVRCDLDGNLINDLRNQAEKIVNKGKTLLARQNALFYRHEELMNRVQTDELVCAKLICRSRESKRKIQQMAKRMIRVLNTVDSYEDVQKEIQKVKTISGKIKDVLCDDDVITDSQDSERLSYHLKERINELSKKLAHLPEPPI